VEHRPRGDRLLPSGEGSYSILSEDAIYNEIHSRLSLVQEMEHTCREILSQE